MTTKKKRISSENEVRLSKNYQRLKENLDPDDILDHMIQRQMISIEEAQEIRVAKTRRTMVESFIKRLLLVGDQFNVFYEILRECDYGYLADWIEGTDVQSTNTSVVEHDESIEQRNNTVPSSKRAENTLYQNTTIPPVDETDGIASSTNKTNADDTYLDVIHSDQSGNPEKRKIGFSANDKQDCKVGDQPNVYEGQNVKDRPEEATYVNDDLPTDRNVHTKHKGFSAKITKETNKLSDLELHDDLQTDSNEYESTLGSCSTDHVYQPITTTQPDYYNVGATPVSPDQVDKTDLHEKYPYGSGSEETACSIMPPPPTDDTYEISGDVESYYDVANTGKPDEAPPIQSPARPGQMSASPQTSNIVLKEPIISVKSGKISHSNDKLYERFTQELANYPGWDQNMTDREIKSFAETNVTEQGQYVIWYSKKKSTIIITVRNPNPGKHCLYYKVKQDLEAENIYYRFGEKGGFRAKSVQKVLDHVKKNGFPVMVKTTRKKDK